MGIQRVFLGFERAALWAAADHLLARAAPGPVADLRGVVAVLPGSRAGRRLLEILVEMADQRGLRLSPPVIETIGRLPEQLYRLKWPLASDLTQQFAWSQVLRRADPTELAEVIPDPPDSKDDARWLEFGDMVRRQHLELAADGLYFRDVVDKGRKLDGFREEARWTTLARLQQDYLRLLDGLELWDEQTARLVAIERRECRARHDIVLIGVVDMSRTIREMLDQVADRVTALVYAPPDWAERFDSHGCVAPGVWEKHWIPLRTEQVMLADGPIDQVDAVADRIGRFQGRYRADEITIGVPDEKMAPTILRRLGEYELPVRWGPGPSITTTGPYRLFQAVADFVGRGRYADFAALVRHPDLHDWLQTRLPGERWLGELDGYYGEHLPASLPPTHPDERHWLGDEHDSQNVRAVARQVRALLGPLLDGKRALGEWTSHLIGMLREIYVGPKENRRQASDRSAEKTMKCLLEQLESHVVIPKQLSPKVTSAEAIRFVLDHTANQTISAEADEAAIELLGWLELPLDDSPAAIITGMNEGSIPESLNSDLFLPNSLRSHLGMVDNSRRYARDAYALSVLTRRDLHLVVGRRSVANDPLVPSRLLFAAEPETVARRVVAFFGPLSEKEPSPYLPSTGVARRVHADLPIPMPAVGDREITQMSVTSFRAYLACPYRFYLRHVLRLRSESDDAQELDGASFGNVMHEVLKRFGLGKKRHSTNPDDIRKVLRGELADVVLETFGVHPLPAIAIQVEQLGARLDAFADRQAAWAADGWLVRHIEVPDATHAPARLDVDGVPMEIVGRIDRIDAHRKTNEHVVLDYKSSDSGMAPDKTHRAKDDWIDLQLPLYRHLVRSLDLDGPMRMGYVVLPKDVGKVDFLLAEWSDHELAEADEVARRVVRCVRRNEFWPPAEPPPPFSEEFAAICQDGVFDKWRPPAPENA